jgi:hypothetical protein
MSSFQQKSANVHEMLTQAIYAVGVQALDNADFAETDIPFPFNVPKTQYVPEDKREDVRTGQTRGEWVSVLLCFSAAA